MALTAGPMVVRRVSRGGTAGRRRLASIEARRRSARREAAQEPIVSGGFEQAAIGIAHVALDGRWLRVNDRLCEIVGYPRAELLRRTMQDVTHPDDLDGDLAQARALKAGGLTHYSREKRYLRPDGRAVWVNLTVSLVRDDLHGARHFISIVEDITERRLARELLARQAGLLDQAYDAIFVWNLRGAITSWNRGAAHLYGYSPDEAVGRISHQLLNARHPDGLAAFLDELERAGYWEGEITHLCRDGVKVVVESRAVLVRDPGGDYVLEVNRDVTARRAQEQRERFLVDVQATVAAATVADDLLTTVTAQIAEFFLVSHVLFAEIDETLDSLRVLHHRRPEPDPRTGRHAASEILGDGARGQLRAGRPVAIDGVPGEAPQPRLSGHPLLGGAQAMTGIPMMRDGRWVALALVADAAARVWSGEEIALLRTVVDRAWLALENMRLLVETTEALHTRDASLAARQESETRLRIALDAAGMGAWEWDPASDRQTQSDAATEMIRFCPDTFAEMLAVIHPDDRDEVRRAASRAVQDGEDYAPEFRVVRPDGGVRWLAARGRRVEGTGGQSARLIGVVSDVTERKLGEDALRKSEARYRRLFEANIVGVFFWRGEGEVTDANDAFLAMIGRTRADLLAGRVRWDALTPEEWREADQRALAELAATGVCGTYEKAFAHRDGGVVPVLITAAILVGGTEDGLALVVDLSERKAQEQFQQEFLADIAHDLRNPLAATKAQAQVMRRRIRTGRVDQASIDEGLESIDANSTRMAKRIEELTDVARLRAGYALELARGPVDVADLVEASVDVYRHATERHVISVRSGSPAPTAFVDANRIERVIDNLLSNAIKYSPDGGRVSVEVEQEERSGRHWIVIRVRDEGVGIPAADLPMVFDRFQRGSNVKNRVGGIGIGLAGARTIVEQHGGEVSVESVEGRGSVFTVRLPSTAESAGEDEGL